MLTAPAILAALTLATDAEGYRAPDSLSDDEIRSLFSPAHMQPMFDASGTASVDANVARAKSDAFYLQATIDVWCIATNEDDDRKALAFNALNMVCMGGPDGHIGPDGKSFISFYQPKVEKKARAETIPTATEALLAALMRRVEDTAFELAPEVLVEVCEGKIKSQGVPEDLRLLVFDEEGERREYADEAARDAVLLECLRVHGQFQINLTSDSGRTIPAQPMEIRKTTKNASGKAVTSDEVIATEVWQTKDGGPRPCGIAWGMRVDALRYPGTKARVAITERVLASKAETGKAAADPE